MKIYQLIGPLVSPPSIGLPIRPPIEPLIVLLIVFLIELPVGSPVGSPVWSSARSCWPMVGHIQRGPSASGKADPSEVVLSHQRRPDDALFAFSHQVTWLSLAIHLVPQEGAWSTIHIHPWRFLLCPLDSHEPALPRGLLDIQEIVDYLPRSWFH